MKAICPVCGEIGSLQLRGNSARIGHYKGIQGKTRVVEWHSVKMVNMVNNDGKKTVKIDKPNSSRYEQTAREPERIWSLGRDLDPRPLPYQGNAPPG